MKKLRNAGKEKGLRFCKPIAHGHPSASNSPVRGTIQRRGQHAGCEALRQHRPQNRSDKHHDEYAIEHSTVEQRLAGSIESPVRDERGRERRRHLRQRERPHRFARRRGVAEGATARLGRDPFANNERTDDSHRKEGVVREATY